MRIKALGNMKRKRGKKVSTKIKSTKKRKLTYKRKFNTYFKFLI